VRFDPHPYQQRALDFALAGSGLLALSMGLGKTSVTLTAIQTLLARCDVRRALVIAPKRVAEHTWPAEARKWDHLKSLRLVTVLGTARERLRALDTPADVHVINRENLPWLVVHCGADWPFDLVVIDESTSFKDRSTQRWKALRKVLPSIARVLLLSGTPAPNSLLDLWAQIYLIDRGARLGRSFTAFRERWFESDFMGYTWALRAGSETAIHALVDDVMLSMRAEDWLDLPERIDVTVPLSLPPLAAQRYRTLQRDYLLELPAGEISAPNAAALVNKLLQAANGTVYDAGGTWHHLHDAKLDALEDLIEAAGEPVLVAYQYRADLDRLLTRFPQAKEVRWPGVIDAWNRREVPVLLAHPASAGHGLNLQAGGRHVIWFGLTWSLEQYLQFNARLHRQGQTGRVIVHHLVAQDTADALVMAALTRKAVNLNALLDALREPRRKAA
jgi:SNF2 family DNA or RNA helicase